MRGRVQCSVLACLAAWSTLANGEPTAWENGYWFNGEAFEQRTVYVDQGVFVANAPADARRVDLGNRYVVPPFGEAHNHDLASDYELNERVQNYLRDGVFYAKMQSSFSVDHPAEQLSGIDSVDVSWAFAPVTGPGGHPMRIREVFFDRGYYEGTFATKAEMADIGYTEIDDAAALADKWPGLLQQGPDFIKVMLSNSEEYALRRDDVEFFGYKGLDPALLPRLVQLSHDAGLRVSTHVDTAADFHYAIAAGVDEISHMPGARQIEVIRQADALRAAEQGTVVVTTLSLTTKIREAYPAWYERLMEQHKQNLQRLKNAGVTVAIGSDMPFQDTSLGEAMLVHSLGVFDNAELLRMWAVNSPRTIFPERRLACFEPGCEASFLVLERDPLEDFQAVREIQTRVKQGRKLEMD